MQTYNEAIDFFHQHFGSKLIADVPTFSTNVLPTDEVTCGICGRTGPGVTDNRPNQRMQRCMPCEGFFHPGPLQLGSRDQSFGALTGESYVVIDSDGLHMFKTEAYLTNKPAYRTLSRPYIHVHKLPAGSPKVQMVIIGKLLSGEFKAPLMWFEVTKNKAETLARMVATTSVQSVIVGSKDGARIIDLDVLREASQHVAAIADLTKQQMEAWGLGKDLYGAPMDRIICADSLRQAGLPEPLLQLDYVSRYFVMGMVPQEAKGPRKPKKGKQNQSASTPIVHVNSSPTVATIPA
jgi:hypothetical protein